MDVIDVVVMMREWDDSEVQRLCCLLS